VLSTDFNIVHTGLSSSPATSAEILRFCLDE
jgi:hypothetical protein